MPERTAERAMMTLRDKARAVRSAKADLEGCESQELMEAAVDEAAAILEDAAELCGREHAMNGGFADG